MARLLLLISASLAVAAEPSPPVPVRDPFAAAATTVPAAAVVPAPPATRPASRLPLVEAVGRSGKTAVAIFSLDVRRIIVMAGNDFAIGQETMTFVTCDHDGVLLRDPAGKDIRLQVIIPAGSGIPQPPPGGPKTRSEPSDTHE